MSIIKQQSNLPLCCPPVINPIVDAVITLIDFPQAARDIEMDRFEEAEA